MNYNQDELLLSVIVPTYNVEKYLEKCIDSIASNLVNNTEILIIDDGSTDSSGQIAEQLQNKYSNVKVFHKPNGGLSDARNYGINQAGGKYLMFIDSDDYVDDSICDILKHLHKDVDVVFVGLNIETLKDNFPITYNPSEMIVGNKNIVYQNLAIRTHKNSACMKVVNRQFILDNNLFFNNGFSEDFNWTGRLFCHINSAIATDICYYHYIAEREGSLMNSFNKKKFYDIIQHADSIMDEINSTQLDKAVVKRIKQFIGFNIISIFRNINKCASKEDKMEVEKLLKDNYKYIKHQKSIFMKAFVLCGRIFGFRLMYKIA